MSKRKAEDTNEADAVDSAVEQDKKRQKSTQLPALLKNTDGTKNNLFLRLNIKFYFNCKKFKHFSF